MAFDPQEWLREARAGKAAPTATSSPAPFDPQSWLAEARQEQQPGPWRSGYQTEQPLNIPKLPPRESLPENQPPEKPGHLAAGLHGLASGATAGFAAQLAGGMGAYGMIDEFGRGDGVAAREVYRKVRDEFKASETASREAHSTTFGLTQVAGAVLTPGPKGVLANAGLGGAYAASQSEGTTLAEVAGDAALGAGAALAVGGAFKGAGALTKKVVGGAPARVEARATDSLLEGTPARTVQDPAIAKLGGKGNIPKVLKAEGLEKLLGGPANKLDAALEGKLDDVGGSLGQIYQKVTQADPGVPPDYLQAKLLALAEKKKADPAAKNLVTSFANDLRANYNEQGAMSAQDLHEVVKVLGRKGFAANVMHPSDASVIRRELRREVMGVLQQHVDDVTKANPEIGSLAELKALNTRYGNLHAIADVAEAKAQRNERYSPTLGQRMQQGARLATGAVGAMGAAQQMVEGNVGVAAVGALAGAAALAGPHIVRAADRLAAGLNDTRLANYLRGSGSGQELLARAVQVGIPRAAAMQVIQQQDTQQPGVSPIPGAEAPLLSSQ